jgi:hypothetical protein
MAKEPKASVTESVLGEMQYEGMSRPRIPSIKTTRMHLPYSVEMPTQAMVFQGKACVLKHKLFLNCY